MFVAHLKIIVGNSVAIFRSPFLDLMGCHIEGQCIGHSEAITTCS